MNKTRQNILLILGVAALVAVPLFMHYHGGEDVDGSSAFAGTDDKAQSVIAEANPDYRPWFSPLWEPPGDSIESLLFALQAAIGSGLVFYYIGYRRGKNSVTANAQRESAAQKFVPLSQPSPRMQSENA